MLPSIPDDGTASMQKRRSNELESDYYVDSIEAEAEVMLPSGAGRQHVNKPESAVRLTHLPPSTLFVIQELRSQSQEAEEVMGFISVEDRSAKT